MTFTFYNFVQSFLHTFLNFLDLFHFLRGEKFLMIFSNFFFSLSVGFVLILWSHIFSAFLYTFHV